jgi:hypothetical protein
MGDFKTSHVFVLSSDGHNWNCFGNGAKNMGDGQSDPIAHGQASSKWASAIYDPASEGDGDGSQNATKPAAGLHLNYDGLCHTAANRVLILAGDSIDTRTTDGDVAAILMYGKLGFSIDQYINLVQESGQAVLKSDPAELTTDDIKIVLSRIALWRTADHELDVLHVDAQEQIDTRKPGTVLPAITDTVRAAFIPIYTQFQNDRADIFKTIAASVSVETQIAYGPFKAALANPWERFSDTLVAKIGVEGFEMIFGVPPEVAASIFK